MSQDCVLHSETQLNLDPDEPNLDSKGPILDPDWTQTQTYSNYIKYLIYYTPILRFI